MDGKRWCMPRAGAEEEALQSNIDYVCGSGMDCGPIKEDGPCFLPNTVQAHAAFAMNLYYQAHGRSDYACDFKQTGAPTDIDPSTYSIFIRNSSLFLSIIGIIYSNEKRTIN